MFDFFTPCTTPENQRVSDIFEGYKMGALAKNGLGNSKILLNHLLGGAGKSDTLPEIFTTPKFY